MGLDKRGESGVSECVKEEFDRQAEREKVSGLRERESKECYE